MEINDELINEKKIRKARNAYMKKWRKDNPGYNRNLYKKAYRKDPARFKAYQNKYWLKKANEEELQKRDDNL